MQNLNHPNLPIRLALFRVTGGQQVGDASPRLGVSLKTHGARDAQINNILNILASLDVDIFWSCKEIFWSFSAPQT